MKDKTFNNRLGRYIRDIYLVPYRSRSGNFAGTHKIGTDKDGKPKYKYLRLKHIKTLKEFFKYFAIVPRPDAWKQFRKTKNGEATYQKLEAQIHRFSAPIRMKDLDSVNHTQNNETSSERPESAKSKQIDMEIDKGLIKLANLLLKKGDK